MTEGPVISMRGVGFHFPGAGPILEEVDLEVADNDFLGLVGPNGGGKTTLLRLILGLLEPQRGTIRVFGEPPRTVSPRIGYVPQHSRIDLGVPAEVMDVILMGRLSHSSWGSRFGDSDVESARRALAMTDTEALSRRRFGELSGGQRQRVLIARALAAEVELLLLDEPTTGVDFHRERALRNLLHRLNETLPIVLVSHDLTLISSHLKRAAWVNRRVTCYPASDLTPELIESIYHGGNP